MAHEYALKIEELNRELKAIKDLHLKVKYKKTTNLLEAVRLKREMSRIETEIAIQRTAYFEWRKKI